MKTVVRFMTAVVPIVICLSAASQPSALTEEEILKGAHERIEKYRMGDATVIVKDRSGRPLANATVRIEQTNHDFLFGCNIYNLFRIRDPKLHQAYQERFKALLNYATLPFYWGSFERRRGQKDFERLERMARWCKENGILTKGHPLVWHNTVPAWAPRDTDKMPALLKGRVEEIVERYKGLINIWDAVNEATVSARVNNGVGLWIKEVGAAAAVGEALNWAYRKNPGAVLIYNDFNVSSDFEKLVANLIEDKQPINAIGIQSHMHSGPWPLTKAWQVCETYARFGLPIHFTELTLLSGRKKTRGDQRSRRAGWDSTPEGEKIQGDYVPKFYTVLFSHPAVEAITWWDFSDLGAWQGAPAGLVRKDMSPKPAYEKLMALIKGKWWTRTERKTDSAGKAKFRGFCGTYRIAVATPDGRKQAADVHLRKGEDNIFAVTMR